MVGVLLVPTLALAAGPKPMYRPAYDLTAFMGSGSLLGAVRVNDAGQFLFGPYLAPHVNEPFAWLGIAGMGLNNLGEVAGCAQVGGVGAPTHAMLRAADGTTTDLGTLGGPDSCALGVSDTGLRSGLFRCQFDRNPPRLLVDAHRRHG